MTASQRRGRGRPPSRALISTSAASTPPLTSAYPSENDEEEEEEDEDSDKLPAKKSKHFKFLELPSELRNKVYSFVFCDAPSVIDLDPDNYRDIHRKISIFFVCRQLCDEASHHFYSTHTVRLFPTFPGRFFKTKRPLLARISPRNRASISTFQLRLGPGFHQPPRGWVVNDALGLKDTVNVRILKCFVEIDPTDNSIFPGFGFDNFYEKFSRKLLADVLMAVPSITEIQFDGYSSVKKTGLMMRGLIEVALQHKKLVTWGPERGWSNDEDASLDEILLVKQMGGLVLSRGFAVHA